MQLGEKIVFSRKVGMAREVLPWKLPWGVWLLEKLRLCRRCPSPW